MAERRGFFHQESWLPYFVHPYNDAGANERTIEVAVALDFLAKHAGHLCPPDLPMRCAPGVLEVGNVLSHYDVTGQDVADRWEPGPGVRNVDVFELSGQWDRIVSISTVEHVRFDEPGDRDGSASWRAIEHLRGLLAPEGRLLVTVPLGWNADLDDDLADRWGEQQHRWGDGSHKWRHRASVHKRLGDGWTEAGMFEYHSYGPAWANAVWVGEWRRGR